MAILIAPTASQRRPHAIPARIMRVRCIAPNTPPDPGRPYRGRAAVLEPAAQYGENCTQLFSVMPLPLAVRYSLANAVVAVWPSGRWMNVMCAPGFVGP